MCSKFRLRTERRFFGGFTEFYSQTAHEAERREILKNQRGILKNEKEILKNKLIPCEREGVSLSLSASKGILAIPGCWQHKGGSWSRESSFEATHHPKVKEGFFSSGLALACPSICPAGWVSGVWVCFSSSLS